MLRVSIVLIFSFILEVTALCQVNQATEKISKTPKIFRMTPDTQGTAHSTPSSSIVTSTGTGWGSTAPPPVASVPRAPVRLSNI